MNFPARSTCSTSARDVTPAEWNYCLETYKLNEIKTALRFILSGCLNKVTTDFFTRFHDSLPEAKDNSCKQERAWNFCWEGRQVCCLKFSQTLVIRCYVTVYLWVTMYTLLATDVNITLWFAFEFQPCNEVSMYLILKKWPYYLDSRHVIVNVNILQITT